MINVVAVKMYNSKMRLLVKKLSPCKLILVYLIPKPMLLIIINSNRVKLKRHFRISLHIKKMGNIFYLMRQKNSFKPNYQIPNEHPILLSPMLCIMDKALIVRVKVSEQ